MRWRTVDKLAKVAAVYGAAVDNDQPPTMAVADALNVSHSQAANLVAKARRTGQLRIPPPDAADAARLTSR